VTEPHAGPPSRPHPQATPGIHGETASPASQSPPPAAASAPRRPVELIVRAKEQLRTLTGYEIDSVSAFTRSDGGWRLSVTVVELHRIPPVTDVLARYDVDLDTEGDVVSYHCGKRYFRAQVGDDT
jgi:hypothetical protein